MLLALDTSSSQTGVALYDGHRVVVEVVWPAPRRHTVELAPRVAWALEQAQIQPEDVRAIAVAIGPGAFTGLRTGVALAKGMALALNTPLIGVFTLDIFAAVVPPEPGVPLIAALPIGRGRFAATWYRVRGNQWRAESRPELYTAALLASEIREPSLVCGEFPPDARATLAANKHVRLGSPAQCTRRPGVLAELAWERFQRGHVDAAETLVPFYVTTQTAIPA
ncbi:MAG: tRNA (adenosine(37)-N6)-threonylcarbamoyltransferase complex dimerization subunit type 1 TsaB [Chloroflexi bacterium]|nr:tRNA (adenosine(37)-N6)-threonylcarbamoyltransferase complex dimerization subunit type 1 TsaB [Chloroflexota bacterium]